MTGPGIPPRQISPAALAAALDDQLRVELGLDAAFVLEKSLIEAGILSDQDPADG